MTLRRITGLLLGSLALLLCLGCPAEPPAEEEGQATGEPALASQFVPTEPIPNGHPLANWAGLRLGMSGFEISQAYNAPEGRGDGFTRVLQQFGSSTTQVITFDSAAGEPLRTLTCAFYRDELFLIVDRREGMSAAQADAWYAELADKYGPDNTETVAGAQWSWGETDGILASFTRDNASELCMTCNLVVEHRPTKDAWHAYNAEWDERHPPAAGGGAALQ